jgi:hypothetical protein
MKNGNSGWKGRSFFDMDCAAHKIRQWRIYVGAGE